MPSNILHYALVILLWGGVIAYVAMIGMLLVNVMTENRNPLSTLGWVTALIFFPVGGALLYFIFGRSLRNVRMISRRNRRRLFNSEPNPPLPKVDKSYSPETRQRVRLGYAVADAILYPDNTVEVFNSGKDLFKVMFSEMRKAVDYINVQFYIISNDPIGRELCDILVGRARSGVKVRVIYDYIGSYGKRPLELFNYLKENGVEVCSFFRIQFPDKISRLNWRNHRKVVVIDGKIGYIGGFNVAMRYVDGGDFSLWRDLMVRVTGPIVTGLQNGFAIDWNFMGKPLLTDGTSDDGKERKGSVCNVNAQIVASGPTNKWAATGMMFFKAISGAKSRVWIQTPYFLPGDDLLKALQCAALSGVDVRVMVPRRSDSKVLTYASNSFVAECLASGIKIYFFRPGMLHSKLLLVDDDFSTLGSTNFDYRSFEHNFEENIVMYSREVNMLLAEMFKTDERESDRIRLSVWNRRSRRERALEAVSRLLSPIL
ncbi:MAG: cardiolipin synthase [Muribaculaceae bacterium]|nr:cardiolipin synthase [Muribaculaceae bacterium]